MPFFGFKMNKSEKHWLNFGLLTLSVSVFLLSFFFFFFHLRWQRRFHETQIVIKNLGRNPPIDDSAEKKNIS